VRLRSVLWLAATGAFAGFLALLTADILDLDEADAAALASAGTAAGASVLWWLHRHLPQQMATMVALMVTAGSLVNDVAPGHDSLPGLGAWTVAATWLLLGWGGLLRPRLVVLPLGAAAMVVSASMTLPTNAGFVLAIGTVAFVVALAVLQSDLLLLAVGAMGTLMVLPAAATEWSRTATPCRSSCSPWGCCWSSPRSGRRGAIATGLVSPDVTGAGCRGRLLSWPLASCSSWRWSSSRSSQPGDRVQRSGRPDRWAVWEEEDSVRLEVGIGTA
jgi:hypothetical protein